MCAWREKKETKHNRLKKTKEYKLLNVCKCYAGGQGWWWWHNFEFFFLFFFFLHSTVRLAWSFVFLVPPLANVQLSLYRCIWGLAGGWPINKNLCHFEVSQGYEYHCLKKNNNNFKTYFLVHECKSTIGQPTFFHIFKEGIPLTPPVWLRFQSNL